MKAGGLGARAGQGDGISTPLAPTSAMTSPCPCAALADGLAQLVEQPLRQLETRDAVWTWRDWLVKPQEEGCWTLQRREGGLEQS